MRTTDRGAAVVMAMLVVAISAALVSGTFLRQSAMARQVENEAAISQAQRLLEGAVDWIRIILREDARTSATDHLGEPWAVPLEQTRLDNESDDPAWISGAIEDAQSRFNLYNLAGPAGPVPNEVAVLRRLLELVGEDPLLAERIAARIDAAFKAHPGNVADDLILPATLDDIVIEEPAERDALARLRPFVTLLPVPSTVNANTAPAEVLAARFGHLSLVDARRLVESRNRAAFKDLNDMTTRLPGVNLAAGIEQTSVATQYFFVRGYAEFRRVRVQKFALLWRHDGLVEATWARDEPT
jgi:general secretion pathway protein K